MEQNNNTRRVISLLVDNSNGVLARISSLLCRRGFNIDSLTVSATNDPAVSRITVTLRGTEQALNQLILQTERLEVTRQIFELDPDKSLQRELLLLKVECDNQNRAELREISSIYKAKIIDLSPDSMIFELTGKPDKIDAFLTMFKSYNILELCRTGVTALERGGKHEHIAVLAQIKGHVLNVMLGEIHALAVIQSMGALQESVHLSGVIPPLALARTCDARLAVPFTKFLRHRLFDLLLDINTLPQLYVTIETHLTKKTEIHDFVAVLPVSFCTHLIEISEPLPKTVREYHHSLYPWNEGIA